MLQFCEEKKFESARVLEFHLQVLKFKRATGVL